MSNTYGKNLGKTLFLELAANLAKTHMVPLNELLSRKQRRPYPELRRLLAVQLYAMGYSQSSIARRMKRHHTTIHMMVASQTARERKRRYWQQYYLEREQKL